MKKTFAEAEREVGLYSLLYVAFLTHQPQAMFFFRALLLSFSRKFAL